MARLYLLTVLALATADPTRYGFASGNYRRLRVSTRPPKEESRAAVVDFDAFGNDKTLHAGPPLASKCGFCCRGDASLGRPIDPIHVLAAGPIICASNAHLPLPVRGRHLPNHVLLLATDLVVGHADPHGGGSWKGDKSVNWAGHGRPDTARTKFRDVTTFLSTIYHGPTVGFSALGITCRLGIFLLVFTQSVRIFHGGLRSIKSKQDRYDALRECIAASWDTQAYPHGPVVSAS